MTRRLSVRLLCCVFAALLLSAPGCAPRVSLFGPASDPLREYALAEGAGGKVLVVHVNGFLGLSPRRGLTGERPGEVQEVLARLKRAAGDPDIKAVVLAINSPGGTVTASDVLYSEIMRYKEKSGAKVVACLLDVAASGGYYAAAAADRIVAHPTTLTGSIGTIFIRPDVAGLMDLVGIRAEVSKSGRLKDMGSPLRASTEEERDLLRKIIENHNARFLSVVSERRALTGERLAAVADARIFTGPQALQAGLVDEVGYMEDALAEARKLAQLPEDCPVVVYRRAEQYDDTPYNAVSSAAPAATASLLPEGAARALSLPPAGFHYLWALGYFQ